MEKLEYILINRTESAIRYNISSNHFIFKNEYLKVNVYYDKIIISIPTIDYNGKTYTSTKIGDGDKWRKFTITNENLKPGKFEINTEESNDDEIVVYLTN